MKVKVRAEMTVKMVTRVKMKVGMKGEVRLGMKMGMRVRVSNEGWAKNVSHIPLRWH